MTNPFFDHPILNSPYAYPTRHWELDAQGQPTQRILESRRRAEFITPIPKPRKRKDSPVQQQLIFDEGKGLSTPEQQYERTAIMINAVRQQVDQWRSLPNPNHWRVTPETARLLQHWRQHQFSNIRPFFCQVEAVETAIWLTEVAPHAGRAGRAFLAHLANANNDANPDLLRLALKLATGAGKTTVMAMLIAWHTINAVRRPNSKTFTRGFLIVAPGLTIRDRLRVLQPNDPDSYYASRELIPSDLLGDLERAKIVITNYHAFRLRKRLELSRGGRALLQGRGAALHTLETEGQMLQRVMPELMGLKNLLVINDEAHHCYREKPGQADDGELKGDDKKEADKNNEAARVWISGLEVVARKLGVSRVIDLSATPFFLRGSGYAEGTLFPWTMSDFSLMDAIECGIVKLPRVPVADNIPGGDMPRFRNLWEHIRTRMPKKGRGKSTTLDPLSLPVELQTALEALYGHYKKTFDLWQAAGISVPPCFIVVCNNTATSKPEFGTVARPDLVAAAREAGDADFDVLIACAFNYGAHSSEFEKLGRIPVLKARMNADLHMADELKNTGKGNLFVIFGEPDIDILPAENGKVQVKINGVDVFHPTTGEVRSDGPEGIACWFIDTDYNEESFFVRHAYFLGANDPYKALKTSLKAEINEEAWAILNSDTSRPFDKPTSGRIAVKVINHLGDEVMKVFKVR